QRPLLPRVHGGGAAPQEHVQLPAALLRPARVGLRLVELDGAAAAADEMGGAIGTSFESRRDHIQFMGLRRTDGLAGPDVPRADEGEREARPRAVPGRARGVATRLLVRTRLRERATAARRFERRPG